MSLEKKREKRRRGVQELVLQGYSYNEIAEKLGVSVPTIVEDVKHLNNRYQKLVVENADYLTRQIEHIFRLQDEFNLIKKNLWEIASKSTASDRDRINALRSLLNQMVHKAKMLNLIQVDKATFNQTYIKIEQIQPMLEQIIYIVKRNVPEDKQIEVLEALKQIDFSRKIGDK